MVFVPCGLTIVELDEKRRIHHASFGVLSALARWRKLLCPRNESSTFANRCEQRGGNFVRGIAAARGDSEKKCETCSDQSCVQGQCVF